MIKSLPNIEKPKPFHETMMEIAPGILAKTSEQNLSVHADHLEKLYAFAPQIYDQVLTWKPYESLESLGVCPNPTGIFTASRILNFSSPGCDNRRTEYLKAVCRHNNLFF